MVRHKYWIETATHKKFGVSAPQAADVCIEDIASHLSRLQRFNGAGQVEYCVAEHCIHASRLSNNTLEKIALLLHDAHEAYIGDIPSPVKRVISDIAGKDVIKILAQRIDIVIEEAFDMRNFFSIHYNKIKNLDFALLRVEAKVIMKSRCLKEWNLPEIPDSYFIEADTFKGMRCPFTMPSEREYAGQPYEEYCRNKFILEFNKLKEKRYRG